MKYRCQKWLPIIFVAGIGLAARAQSPEEQARKFVDATWGEADAVAKMLVLRDFLESFNEFATTLSALSAANTKSVDLPSLRTELTAALARSAGTGFAEVEQGERDLSKVLQKYRTLVALRYRLSWYSLNALVESRAVVEAAPQVASLMKQKCDRGSSLEGSDFFTAPRPALPRLDLQFSGRLTVYGDPAPGNLPDEFRVSAGNDSNDRNAWIAGGSTAASLVCAAIPYTAPVYYLCGAGAGLIISGIFALTDLDSQNEKLAEMARAEALRFNGRAVAKDVNELYRKRCGYAVRSLDRLALALRVSPEERAALVQRSDSPEVQALRKDATREAQARCRISAVDLNQKFQCPAEGSAALRTTFSTDPACSRLLRTPEQCPQVVSSADNGCRRAADGTLSLYKTRIESPDSGAPTLEGTAECKIVPPYDIAADKAVLAELAAKRFNSDAQAKYADDAVMLLTSGMLKALSNTEDLRSAFVSGEDELDRQQQFALTKMIRLIQFVRLRKQLLILQEKVGQAPVASPTLRASVGSLVSSSGRALVSIGSEQPGSKFFEVGSKAVLGLSEADFRSRDLRVREFRILSNQLAQTFN